MKNGWEGKTPEDLSRRSKMSHIQVSWGCRAWGAAGVNSTPGPHQYPWVPPAALATGMSLLGAAAREAIGTLGSPVPAGQAVTSADQPRGHW